MPAPITLRGRTRRARPSAAAAGALAVSIALLAGAFGGAAAASGRYDLRGVWDTYGTGGGYSGTFTVASMNLASGAFSGTGDGTAFVLKGSETATAVSFTQSQGSYVSHDAATVVMRAGKLAMISGTWHDSNGSGGTFTATLVKKAPTSTPAGPAPVAGSSVAAGPLAGSVLVKRPGASGFTRRAAGALVPVGSTVDARHGRVRITSAAHGSTYSGVFYGGEFVVTQSASGATDLALTGGTPCASGARAGAAARGAPRRRSLWSTAHGSFTTSGRYAAATELGTRWLTADRCTVTLIRVTSGAVRVRDLVRKRSFVLRAPGSRLVKR